MPEYKGPGVYVEEIHGLPPSVAALPTHIPVFIGYTEQCECDGKTLLNTPKRISSLREFERYFGTDIQHKFTVLAAKRGQASDVTLGTNAYCLRQNSADYMLYRSIALYFSNGGGSCYIVSVGNYQTPISVSALVTGLAAVAAEEMTAIVVIPDAVALSSLAECSQVQQALINFCVATHRFAILDIYQGYFDRNEPGQRDCIEDFRTNITGSNLSYAAAYYPWLQALIVSEKQLSFANMANVDGLKKLLIAELDLLYPNKNRQTLVKRKQITSLLDNIAKVEIHSCNEKQLFEYQQLNSNLLALSPLYSQIITSISQKLNSLPPSGAICGAYVKNDLSYGVWKAPANLKLLAVSSPCITLDNNQQQELNVTPSGKSVNALRSFPNKGTLIWGARTLLGNDNEWRYINIRRTALMLEQSIASAIEPMIFEPNEHDLWVKVKAMCDNFLQHYWREGALAGAKPEHAYFVKVGLGQTMTEVDIRDGRLIVQIGIAMTKPAEFIVLTIKQLMSSS